MFNILNAFDLFSENHGKKAKNYEFYTNNILIIRFYKYKDKIVAFIKSRSKKVLFQLLIFIRVKLLTKETEEINNDSIYF